MRRTLMAGLAAFGALSCAAVRAEAQPVPIYTNGNGSTVSVPTQPPFWEVGDASATSARPLGVSSAYSARTMAARLADTVNVMDFAPAGGTVGGGLVALVASTQSAAGTGLAVAANPAVAVGMHIAGLAVPTGATITALSTAGGVTTLTLSSATTSAIAAGQSVGISATDDTAAFDAAAALAMSLGAATLEVPRGVYLVSAMPTYTNTGITWDLAPGAAFFGSDIPGFTGAYGFATGYQGEAMGVEDDMPNVNSNVAMFSQHLGNSGATINTQKDVVSAQCVDADVTGGTHVGCLVYYGKASFSGGNNNGSEWLWQGQLQIPTGTDGYAVVLEGGIENHASYQPSYGGVAAKLGLHIGCSGPVDCTAGSVIASFGGLFHYGYYLKPGAIRSDGYAFMYQKADGTAYYSVDVAGNVAAGAVSASGNISGAGGSFTGGVTAGGAISGGSATISNAVTAANLTANYNLTALGGYVLTQGNIANFTGYASYGLYTGVNASGGGLESDVVGVRGLSLFAVPTSSTTALAGAVPALKVGTDQSTTLGGVLALKGFAVAALPACSAGQMTFATNGRNTGQAAGAGTGTPVFCDSTAHWLAVWSGVAVAA